MAKVKIWICTTVLLLAGLYAWAQKAHSLTYSCKDKPITEVFDDLKKSYGIIFAYDPAIVKDTRVTVTLSQKNLSQAMRTLVEWTQLDYQIVKNNQVIIRKKYQIGIDLAGVIRDIETGESLPYAQVMVPDTKFGATADENGRFLLKGIPSTSRNLVIYYVGYQSLEVYIKSSISRKRLVFDLKSIERRLDEIVIEQGTDQSMKVSDGAAQIMINPKKISALSGLGEEDLFRSMKLLPGVGGGNAGSTGLYVRGGTPDQNLVLFDGITAYRVDHFFGHFSAFNAEAVKHLDIYRGGFGAQYGGRVSSVIDITGRNGSLEKPSVAVGANLLNAQAVVETPIFKKRGSLLLAARRSYSDAIRSPFFKNLFNNIVDQGQEEIIERDPDVLNYASGSSLQFYQANQKFKYKPSVNNFATPTLDQNNAAPYYNLNSNLTYLDRNRDGINVNEPPGFHYYDINAKLTYQPSKKDVVAVTVYSGNDNLDYEYNDEPFRGIRVNTTDQLKLTNLGTSLTWSRQWNKKVYMKTNIAHSRYGSQYQYNFISQDDHNEFSTFLDQSNSIYDLTLRTDTKWAIDEHNKFEFGAQLTQQKIDFSLISDTFHIQNRDGGASASGYAQHRFAPSQYFDLTVGVRGTYFELTKRLYVEPRLAIKAKIHDHVRVKAAWGIYNQFINRVNVNNGLGLGEDFWALANGKDIPVTSSQHIILGAAYETPKFLIDVEAYRKNTNGLLTYSFGAAPLEIQNADNGDGDLITGGTAVARGIDFLIQKKVGQYTGWVGYSLSKVEHSFSAIDLGLPFPALHDQRHEIKTAHIISWRDWDLASTFNYASGKPYTDVQSTALFGEPSHKVSGLIPDRINAQRLPDYHRLDFSLTHNLTFPWAKAKVGFSIYNIYGKSNVRSRKFILVAPINKDDDPTISAIDIYDLGFTPNVFFHIRF